MPRQRSRQRLRHRRIPRSTPRPSRLSTLRSCRRPPEPSAAASAEPDAASPDPTTPVDQPTVDPSEVVDAIPASAIVPTEDGSVDPTAAGTLRREVFGFLPYWELSASSTTLNYDLLSTIAYFGVGVENDGDLLKRNADGSITTGWGGWTSATMTTVINAAHQKGTRVVLTLQKFAWSSSQASAQAALLGSATARANLARQAAAAVRDRGADGINIDFEPIASGHADEFTLLVRAIRAELDAIALGYQLTFDTTGYIGNYPIEAATAPGGADAIFVMGYDYRTAGATNAGSISPIAGPIYDLTDTLAAYTARIPASKLILGVPYYGRAWSTVSDALNARNQSGTKFGASTTVIYETAVDLAAQHGRRYDPTEQAPWFAYRRQNCTTAYGCVTSWREVYYDDPQSLGAKYDLMNRQGLRGAGIWALGYDGTRPELYRSIASKFTGAITTGAAVTRLAGADRFATAAAISQAHFGPGVPVVYITNGLNFPDALAGGPAAAKTGGPILPVRADAIPASIAAELGRLNPARIVVLGGPVMVSNAVAATLDGYTAGSVTRLAGADRFATAAAISQAHFGPGVPVVYITNGLNFPDALAGGPAAAKTGGPILPVRADAIPASIAAELGRLNPGRIVVLGGPVMVSNAVAATLDGYTAGSVTRLAGADRFATAAAISQAHFGPGVPVVYITNGLNFPDALAGGPAAAKTGGPILPVRADAIPPSIAAELGRLNPGRIVVLGGPVMVSNVTSANLHAYLP